MFLSAYHFDGDPDELLPAYARLNAMFPASVLQFHACVVREGGLTVIDACPSRSIAEAFSDGPEFGHALVTAGLPAPRKERLGDVHAAFVSGEVVPT